VDKGLRRLFDAVATSRLCYGEPVREGERTIIPVARVRVSGGWGSGRFAGRPGKGDDGKGDEGGGAGGGGYVEGLPVGFIEVGPDGSRFVDIPDPDRTQNLLRTSAKAFGTVLTAVAGARALTGGVKRRPAGLLGRGK
jgi:uncharacterized spore protein YtfJ